MRGIRRLMFFVVFYNLVRENKNIGNVIMCLGLIGCKINISWSVCFFLFNYNI